MFDFPSRELTFTDPTSGEARSVVARQLAGSDDYALGEALQRQTWGEGFREIASATVQMISQKVGGLAAGVFDASGEMLAFLFGLTGLRQGRPAHWSHVLAVRPELRSSGLGRRLKEYQRDFLLAQGVDRVYWSYDPLVARNAHLNLNRLGAEPVEYVRDLYGPGEGNELHRGIGTDRFIVEWRLDAPRVERALAGEFAFEPAWVNAPLLNVTAGGEPLGEDAALPPPGTSRVEVPDDVQQLKDEVPEAGPRWRSGSRRAFLACLESGGRVAGFYRDRASGRCFYVLTTGDEGAR